MSRNNFSPNRYKWLFYGSKTITINFAERLDIKRKTISSHQSLCLRSLLLLQSVTLVPGNRLDTVWTKLGASDTARLETIRKMS